MKLLSVLLFCASCTNAEHYTLGNFSVITEQNAKAPNDLPECLAAINQTIKTSVTIHNVPGWHYLGAPRVACDYDGFVIRRRDLGEDQTKNTCLPHEIAHHIEYENGRNRKEHGTEWLRTKQGIEEICSNLNLPEI